MLNGMAMKDYTIGNVAIIFSGPVDCAHCPLLETYARNQCRRTGEYVVDIRGIGKWCPIEFEKVTDSNESV